MSLELCAVHFGNPHDITKALLHCNRLMKFDKITLLHPNPYSHPEINVVKVDSPGNNLCVINELPKAITCDHALGIHWDGFIVDPEMWTDEFLEYDFIGCPWNLNNLPNKDWRVGSGGFYMFSNRMAQAWGHICNLEEHNDWQIGALYRDKFEDLGMKYAPFELASRFGRECELEIEDEETFGFHGFQYKDHEKFRSMVYP